MFIQMCTYVQISIERTVFPSTLIIFSQGRGSIHLNSGRGHDWISLSGSSGSFHLNKKTTLVTLSLKGRVLNVILL